MQFRRRQNGLGSMLRKMAGKQAANISNRRRPHPAVHHLLLVHRRPLLAVRISRKYGRSITALSPNVNG